MRNRHQTVGLGCSGRSHFHACQDGNADDNWNCHLECWLQAVENCRKVFEKWGNCSCNMEDTFESSRSLLRKGWDSTDRETGSCCGIGVGM